MKTRESTTTRGIVSSAGRISSSAMLGEAADRMKKLGLDGLPVVENNEIVGRITDRDIARAVSAGMSPTTTPVKYAMTTTAAPAQQDRIRRAAGTKEGHHARRTI
jgi:CBS domain-containing protein